MSKTENPLVFPSDDYSSEEITTVRRYLQDAGFSETDLDWLVDVFKRQDCFGDPNGESVFRNEWCLFDEELKSSLRMLKERVHIGGDRQTTLAFLFSSMLGCGPGGGLEPNERANSPGWIREFQKHAKFCAKSLDWKKLRAGSPNAFFDFDNLVLFLFPEGLPLAQVVDLALLNPVRPQSWSSTSFNDPKQLEFWLSWRFRENKERSNIIDLRTLVPDFAKFPENVLGEKILGLCNAIFCTMSSSRLGGEVLNPVRDGWRAVRRELIPFLKLLDGQKPETIQEPSTLLKAWWHLVVYIFSGGYGGVESELSDDLKSRLIESASRHIGILRSVLRDTPEEFKNEDVRDFYDKAFYVLLCFAPGWKCLKPLLLAFTEMTKQAVASDLRTWSEHDSKEDPPQPYARVPNWIEVAMYPQNLKSELEKDPYLQDLREEFAKFCLERLRTKVKNKDSGYTDEDFIEPRPAWRQCYVQALAALRVNPGGRGHRTLFWLLNNDPDETVRELAKKAHKRVRHLDRNKPNLDEGASPRRPLFEAWWWLRQAHLITLEEKIDQAGAMRTRRRELHRTQEKDDVFKRR